MEVEQRRRPVQLDVKGQPVIGRSPEQKTKSFQISKHLVLEAWKQVKANKGGPGVDGQNLKEFEVNLKDNLYRLWNRLSSVVITRHRLSALTYQKGTVKPVHWGYQQ